MRYATILLALGTLASMLVTGGCVSKSDYDNAVASARRAQDELRKSAEALAAVRAENQSLKEEIAARDRLLAAKDAEINNWRDKFNALQDAYNKLKEAYDKLSGQAVAPPQITALPKDLSDAIRKWVDSLPPGTAIYDETTGMVKFASDLLFEKGSDVVNPKAASLLQQFAQIVNRPDAQQFYLYVAGHTDDIPIKSPAAMQKHGTNWGLSVHRSLSVIKVLTDAGVQQPRMGAMGYSKWHPVAPNAAGEKGNAKNRRVEIWLVPADKFLSGDMKPSAKEASNAAPAAAEEPAAAE